MLSYDEAIAMIHSTRCGYAIIDPGASFAMRIVQDGRIAQYLIRADLADTDYAGRMAYIAHELRANTFLKDVKIFFIEHQYENNVLIQYGAIVGILMTLAHDKLVLRTKRTGRAAVQSYGPHICDLPVTKKTEILGKQRNYTDRKEAACQYALANLDRNDPAYEYIATDGSDDVADTVCYHYKIFQDTRVSCGILGF